MGINWDINKCNHGYQPHPQRGVQKFSFLLFLPLPIKLVTRDFARDLSGQLAGKLQTSDSFRLMFVMVSMEESSELLATYAGLGTHDGTKYYRGDECLGR